jgi:hypothetical protein
MSKSCDNTTQRVRAGITHKRVRDEITQSKRVRAGKTQNKRVGSGIIQPKE